METGIAIVTAIIIAIVIIPIALMQIGTKKRNKQLLNKLEAMASQNKGKITDYDTHKTFAIGFDHLANHVYFYKNTPDAEITQDIDLKKIRNCEIVRQTTRARNGKQTNEVLEKLLLAFKPYNGGATQHIELYDAEESFQLSGELDIATKWSGLILASRNQDHRQSYELDELLHRIA